MSDDFDMTAILGEFGITPVKLDEPKKEPVRRKRVVVKAEPKEPKETLITQVEKMREADAESVRKLADSLKGKKIAKVKAFLTEIAKKIVSKRSVDKERFEREPVKRYDVMGYRVMGFFHVGKWDNKRYTSSLRKFYDTLPREKYATHTDDELLKEWADANPSVYSWVKEANEDNSKAWAEILARRKDRR
jgi:mRNA-degrading endonuclease RelE of RelBE toxin-antitoxin system